MALIDISELITDPDFASQFQIIRRAAALNQFGELELTETPENVTGCIQGIDDKTLQRLPESAQFSEGIRVWFRGVLDAESAGGYCDVIVFRGLRYLVKVVNQEFLNWGSGWSSAVCAKEVPNA